MQAKEKLKKRGIHSNGKVSKKLFSPTERFGYEHKLSLQSPDKISVDDERKFMASGIKSVDNLKLKIARLLVAKQ